MRKTQDMNPSLASKNMHVHICTLVYIQNHTHAHVHAHTHKHIHIHTGSIGDILLLYEKCSRYIKKLYQVWGLEQRLVAPYCAVAWLSVRSFRSRQLELCQLHSSLVWCLSAPPWDRQMLRWPMPYPSARVKCFLKTPNSTEALAGSGTIHLWRKLSY